MHDSHKNSNKKPVKIYLKTSKINPKKISTIKEEEFENKNNQKDNSSLDNNNKIKYENNIKLLEELNNELNDIEKQNDLILKELSSLKAKQKDFEEEEKKINNEIETENGELDDLKETNILKNREYLELLRKRHQQIRENYSNEERNQDSNNNSNEENNNNENNDINRLTDMMSGLNFLLNISRFRRMNEEENNESIRINSFSNDDNNEEGPPMTNEQFQALPISTYPNNNNTDEKCEICGFVFCYKDTITKLRCDHTFHKDCLVNRLSARNSSKCPICKASII